jgi:uridine kinase
MACNGDTADMNAKTMTLPEVIHAIQSARSVLPASRSLLVGITGIDGSGKGYVTKLLAEQLEGLAFRVAAINIDPWLNLPSRRFDPNNPARHFYEQGIRFNEAFEHLILPLQQQRTHSVLAQVTDATNAERYRLHAYDYANIDIILLDGIFLLKRELRDFFELVYWIECTFETALERALARGQEGLPDETVIGDYQTIYFPAQRIHLEEDRPKDFASGIVANDPRIDEK